MNRPSHEVVADIMKHGPNRVVINSAGEALSSFRAKEFYGVTSDIIFIRDDEWSLGAPFEFEEVAYDIWADKWVGYLCRPGTHMRSMEDYQHEAGRRLEIEKEEEEELWPIDTPDQRAFR